MPQKICTCTFYAIVEGEHHTRGGDGRITSGTSNRVLHAVRPINGQTECDSRNPPPPPPRHSRCDEESPNFLSLDGMVCTAYTPQKVHGRPRDQLESNIAKPKAHWLGKE